MIGASKTLDPIAAAEADIAGSKDLIAAVARDLGQHERWLAHYHVAEKRHARRVMVQEALYQLELARERMVRMLTRLALRAFQIARAIAVFFFSTGIAFVLMLHRAATACLAWLRPRLYALALTLQSWLIALQSWIIAFCVWGAATSRRLAITLWKLLIAFSVWAYATSRVLARAAAKYASIAAAWLGLQARSFAIWLEKRLARLWSWSLRNGTVLARASLEGASIAASWLAATSLKLAIWLRHWLYRTGKRAAAQARILYRASLGSASVASAWIAATSRVLAATSWRWTIASRKWLATAFTRARREARVLGRASRDGASRGSAWVAATSQEVATTLRSVSSSAAAWTAAKARTSARRSVSSASAAYGWVALNIKSISRSTWRATPQADSRHTSLVVRQCTALVSFEPPRAGLPAVHAASAATISSRAVHASP